MNLKTKFMLFALLAVFGYMAYFFIAHAYVFVRLTTVIGVMGFVAIALALAVYLFGRIK